MLPTSSPPVPSHLQGASGQPLSHASLRQQQLAARQLLGLADVEGRDGVWCGGQGRLQAAGVSQQHRLGETAEALASSSSKSATAPSPRSARCPQSPPHQARHTKTSQAAHAAPVMREAARHTSRSSSGRLSEGSTPCCSCCSSVAEFRVGRPAGCQAASAGRCVRGRSRLDGSPGDALVQQSPTARHHCCLAWGCTTS